MGADPSHTRDHSRSIRARKEPTRDHRYAGVQSTSFGMGYRRTLQSRTSLPPLLAITKIDYYKGTYKPPIRIDGPRVVPNRSNPLRFLRHLPPLAPPLPPPLPPLHDFLPPLPPRRRLRSLLDLLYPASLGRGRLDGGGLW